MLVREYHKRKAESEELSYLEDVLSVKRQRLDALEAIQPLADLKTSEGAEVVDALLPELVPLVEDSLAFDLPDITHLHMDE